MVPTTSLHSFNAAHIRFSHFLAGNERGVSFYLMSDCRCCLYWTHWTKCQLSVLGCIGNTNFAEHCQYTWSNLGTWKHKRDLFYHCRRSGRPQLEVNIPFMTRVLHNNPILHKVCWQCPSEEVFYKRKKNGAPDKLSLLSCKHLQKPMGKNQMQEWDENRVR